MKYTTANTEPTATTSSKLVTPLRLALAAICAFSLAACDVKKTEEGEAPSVDVDVDADPGKLPKYDVETADVDVTTEEKEVLVPKVVMEKETIETPEVNVTMPDEKRDVPATTPAPAAPATEPEPVTP